MRTENSYPICLLWPVAVFCEKGVGGFPGEKVKYIQPRPKQRGETQSCHVLKQMTHIPFERGKAYDYTTAGLITVSRGTKQKLQMVHEKCMVMSA